LLILSGRVTGHRQSRHSLTPRLPPGETDTQ
jgi:hypothetical protein